MVYKEGKTTDLMCHSSDVFLKTVITRAPRVIVSGGRVSVRMGPGPTNSLIR